MKKSIAILLCASVLIIMTACSAKVSDEQTTDNQETSGTQVSIQAETEASAESVTSQEETTSASATNSDTDSQESLAVTSETQGSTEAETETSPESVTSQEETSAVPEETASQQTEQTEQLKEDEPMEQEQFYITAKNTTFTADFADSDSADAFRELLSEGDLTVSMSDYGGFEKVGNIGKSLPRKDTQISTTTGDIMLYQGDQIVIFYGKNSWSYSRLGRIEDASAEDLISAFGKGDADITFSLTKPQ